MTLYRGSRLGIGLSLYMDICALNRRRKRSFFKLCSLQSP
nr:MAG TPA_asm: hypothetical protein [Caudoviricetes sp.]